jgi:phosphoribosylformylglycinamidine cyclo-ligase
MEIYVDQKFAEQVIAISRSFNIDAKVIGRVEAGTGRTVSVRSPYGEFVYS